MCGIAGVIGNNALHHARIDEMVEVQHRRGPDGHGVWKADDGRCTLGHRRLAVIDTTDASAQPFVSPDGRFALTYNGEIYNYVELRRQLEGDWHFETRGDTEVLLASYAVWGHRCVERLNGMFAFAVWDTEHEELFLARDRMGEKPLYYAQDEGSFLFASEIKALAVHDLPLWTDQTLAVSYLLGTDGVDLDGRRTMVLGGVSQLLPGECASVTLTGTDRRPRLGRTETYWSVQGIEREPWRPADLGRYVDEVGDLLLDSVRLRLRSDVPVGTCLSGGLDSSAVVAMIRKLEPEREIKTFTGRFLGEGTDEGPYAREVSAHVGTDYHEVIIRPENFLGEVAEFYRAAELPIGGLSQYGQWSVFRLASENGVTVLLDGQGSDELLGGYGSGISHAYLRTLLWTGQLRSLAHELAVGRTQEPATFAPKALAKTIVAARLRSRGPRGRVRNYLSPTALEIADAGSVGSLVVKGARRNELSRVLQTLATRTMLTSLLRYGDHLSMQFSREVRLPFCDHRLVELAFRLPAQALMGEASVKRVLREAMAPPALPHDIAFRRKQGFNPDSGAWLSEPLRPWMQEMIAAAPDSIGGLIDRQKVLRDLHHPPAAGIDWAVMWRLANLCAWGNLFLADVQRAGSPS